MNKDSTLHPLLNTHRKPGLVEWIGLRGAHRDRLTVVDEAIAKPETGLEGDHYAGRPGGKRQVTLIQAEHLQAVASILGVEFIDPHLTRRNIVVRGINLKALKNQRLRIGEAILEYSGECHPCSRMEENLGPGGYNAMRGHGGILARVLAEGPIRVGDTVETVSLAEQDASNDSN
ncbi:MAG: MOSC domain-containing protein [Rhodothermales bacterium]|nr:MOSC domain-containing protein [Rhodothermales bacterium]